MIYPSLYEGFGLPVLEAMSCGTPVLTSNISSMPEVIGKAGILFNPYDIGDIAEAIRKVLHSDDLRDRMRNDGLQRANMFSWAKCAKETLEIYKSI